MTTLHSRENNLASIIEKMRQTNACRACGITPATESSLAGLTVVLVGARAINSVFDAVNRFAAQIKNPNIRPWPIGTLDCVHCIYEQMEAKGVRFLLLDFDYLNAVHVHVWLFSGDQTCRDVAAILKAHALPCDPSLIDGLPEASTEALG